MPDAVIACYRPRPGLGSRVDGTRTIWKEFEAVANCVPFGQLAEAL